MKKFKKICLALLIGGLIFAAGSGIYICVQGYQLYRSAVEEINLSDKVEQLRSDINFVKSENISTDFLNAIVAIEDRNFRKHGPINLSSISRAIIINIKTRAYTEGGSTITQQLAKNIYFSMDKELSRKVAEVFVAYELEKNYSKDEILELYVNVIYFGDGYNGIRQASLGYFNLEPKDITLDQATLLAGLPKAPSLYALSNHADRAYVRQKDVIAAMVENGYITPEEAEILMKN